MSSPKRASAAKSSASPKSRPSARLASSTPAKAAAKSAAKAATSSAPAGATNGSTSSDATKLAAEIERALASGKLDSLTPGALHALMSACCKTYATRIEAGEDLLPLAQRSTVSPTEVMVTASGLLRAANLAVFELGMWQSWTGR
jgi:hypothetical protein